jgi:TATA-binding protein-associated factor Taf7
MEIFMIIVFILYRSFLVKCDFLIDQRMREEQRIRPPNDPFFNTFYDKSYYYSGIQRPIYHVKKKRARL